MITVKDKKQQIDTNLVCRRFKSVSETYNKHAVIQKKMAVRLIDMALHYLSGNYQNMLEIGCGTGVLSNEILRSFNVQHYMANDLVGEFESLVAEICALYSHASFSFFTGDAVQMNVKDEQDVIWSGAALQWITDLDSFFLKIKRMLKPDGYFVFSTFERFNYKQIRQLTGTGIQYTSLQDILILAKKNFNVLDYQIWMEKLWFQTPRDVLKHMQYTGVNAIKSEKWNKSNYIDFQLGYEKFKEDAGYPLTYHPVLMILQAK